MAAVRLVYGLLLSGTALEEVDTGLLPDGDALRATAGQVVQIDTAVSDPLAGPVRRVDVDEAKLDLPGGRWLRLSREPSRAIYSGPELPADELVHPYLSPIGIFFNRWRLREVFHAGSFACANRAWMIIGPREAGKSSLLATLHESGATVLSDDISVTDGTVVYAGPRCVDLRQEPGSSDWLVARQESRWRLRLPECAPSCPLGGWLFLNWGDESKMAAVAPPELLRMLARRRLQPQLPCDPSTLLSLANRPAWIVTRRRRWEEVGETISTVLDAINAASYDAEPSAGSRPPAT
jgi:hypothetical protein